MYSSYIKKKLPFTDSFRVIRSQQLCKIVSLYTFSVTYHLYLCPLYHISMICNTNKIATLL